MTVVYAVSLHVHPSGDRTLLGTCPWCRCLHRHHWRRGPEPGQHIPSCGTPATYTVKLPPRLANQLPADEPQPSTPHPERTER